MDLAPGSFWIAQVLLAGMVLSALMHPLFLATILMVAAKTAIWGDLGTKDALLALFGLANIAAGYGAFIMIGYLALSEKERRGFATIVAGPPVPWRLLSVAAWGAIYDHVAAPHRWHKTPHQPSAPSLQPVAPIATRSTANR